MKGGQQGLFEPVDGGIYRVGRWRMSEEATLVRKAEQRKKWVAANPKKLKASRMRIRNKNSEKLNANSRRRCAEYRKELIDLLGGPKCACDNCDQTNPKKLLIDHVNGDGAEDREEYSKGSKGVGCIPDRVYVKRLKDGTQKRPLQVLCRSCNVYKRNLPKCPCAQRLGNRNGQ